MMKVGDTTRGGTVAEARRGALGREWCEGGVVEALRMERRRALRGIPATNEGLPDPMDEARKREDEAVWLAALDRSRDFQVTVEAALNRLATGEYGRCLDCGGAIAMARLRALPFAVRCLACQERVEQKREAAARRAAR